MDRAARLAAVRAATDAAGCEALVVSKPVNIRWLTGFTGSNGLVVVAPDRLTVITDGRYTTQVARQLAAAEVEAGVVIDRDPRQPLIAALDGVATVGLESDHISWAEQRRYAQWLGEERLVATDGLIELLRRHKDDGELDRLRRAAAIADAALDRARPELAQGRTEREIAQLLDRTMVDLGADGLSFPTIVAAGPNSALPHATPSGRPIATGDLVIIDFGAAVDGYGSDMTRSFTIGQPTADQRRLVDAVAGAQAAGVAAVADGVEELTIDHVCRQHLDAVGLADAFVHGTGHGIGLEIHENPILSSRATGILRSGYVVTVEPGVYLPDVGGVRIEDSVVVTDTGCEPITLSPKVSVVDVAEPTR